MITFETYGAYLKNGKLKADDGSTYAVNDHIYLICEPPGEPYYLARIMEFLPSKDKPSGPIESVRVNWYYRPRDIPRKSTDTRLVFASMHSDICPLTSLRGRCQISHLSEIDDLAEYRKTRDCFWYDKLFDRYIHRYYDMIPTSKVINVPSNVKKVLDERWKFVLVEVGKRKELTGAVKTCKRCGQYAASNNSVDCAVCNFTYHMDCVRPVLTRKPARGFAWACAACSRAQERKLEARNTPLVNGSRQELEEELLEEEDEELNGVVNGTTGSTPAPAEESLPQPATAEQIAQAKLWPYRYLGIHCRVEDALDYDDRIYPRASSRLGTRHQANVPSWFGHPVEYTKPLDIKKKYLKSGNRKESKLTKEAQAAIEAAKQEMANRPKWVMDEPPGYVRRGEDEPVMVDGKPTHTAELLFKMPTAEQLPARGEDDAPRTHVSDADREKFVEDYMNKAKDIATEKGVEQYSTNFLDKALQLLYSEAFDVEAALAKLKQVDKYTDLKEPRLQPEEIKIFEQGVSKYGSELRLVTKHVKTVPHNQIVRYYYMWKKTPRGRQIWGNYEGRRGKREARRNAPAKLVDDVADDQDDSAFDNVKVAEKKRAFNCKFCSTKSSRQWRRAPGVQPNGATAADTSSKKEKGASYTVALCLRCALLWRKYAIQWEDVDEVAKKISQSSHKSWRRRVDEELLAQLLVSTETPINISSATAATAASLGVTVNAHAQVQQEPPKKKTKYNDRDSTAATSTATSVEPAPKKKPAAEKALEPPPIIPDPPKAKTLPCAICNKLEPMGDQHLSCRDCRLTVHRGCYGVHPSRNCAKWLCDMCANDRNPVISTRYECVLCPVTWTEHELMEAPRVSHKKKSEREREKERLEKEMVTEAIKLYRQRQEAVGKPINPREPLKRTVGNNWVHVLCALWQPEIKFGNAEELEPAENFGMIPTDRHQEACKICKTSNTGACISCHYSGCNAKFHVGCAFQAQYKFGFDISPVKNSRRDSVSTVRLGDEVGVASPAIWCPHHAISGTVHEIGEPTGKDGLNALQVFARTYKQADLSLPGTVRKAAYIQRSVGVSQQHSSSVASRRSSGANGVSSAYTKDSHRNTRTSPDGTVDAMVVDSDNHTGPRLNVEKESGRKCFRCSTTFSPRWWPVENMRRGPIVRNGTPMMNGVAPNDPSGARFPNATSASPPFHARNLSQGSFTRPNNGEYHPPDRNGAVVHEEQSLISYECHKCHLKGFPQPSPEPRPSPYTSQRPVLPTPAPKLLDYHPHPYSSHPHPMAPAPAPAPGILPRPVGSAPPHTGPPDWYPGYDQRLPAYGDSSLRNGMPAPAYHAGPAPPSHHGSGYQAPHPAPQPHYANGPPPLPPQAYATHQSPYAPVSAPSPHLPQAPRPHPFAASVSPPSVQATMVQRSPPFPISTPSSGPPLPLGYPVDRVLTAPTPSPSLTHAHVDPKGPQTPGKLDDATAGGAARQMTNDKAGSGNGASGSGNTASGASASPSLKNLLS